MDWGSLIVGILIGLVANLLTPVVRKWLNNVSAVISIKSRIISGKLILSAINNINEEKKLISEMHQDKEKSIFTLLSRITGQLLYLAIFTLLLYIAIVLINSGIESKTSIYGAMGGISGLCIRQIIEAASMLNIIKHVSNYEEYMSKTNQRLDVLNEQFSKANN